MNELAQLAHGVWYSPIVLTDRSLSQAADLASPVRCSGTRS